MKKGISIYHAYKIFSILCVIHKNNLGFDIKTSDMVSEIVTIELNKPQSKHNQ